MTENTSPNAAEATAAPQPAPAGTEQPDQLDKLLKDFKPTIAMVQELLDYVPSLNRVYGIGVDMTVPHRPEFNMGGAKRQVHVRDIFRLGMTALVEALSLSNDVVDPDSSFYNVGIPEKLFDGFVPDAVVRDASGDGRSRLRYYGFRPAAESDQQPAPETTSEKEGVCPTI